jgi:hypothetical protein
MREQSGLAQSLPAAAARSTPSRARLLVPLAVIVALALLVPASARAGAYRAALCDPDFAAFHADAAFERSSRRYLPRSSCGVGGDGLAIRREANGVGAGAWGAWVIRAPYGTAISGLGVNAAGLARGGQVPELLVGSAANPRPFATPTGGMERFGWSGAPARTFAARLRCRPASGCPRGRRARIRIKRVALLLRDGVRPRLHPDGSLLGPGSRRGIQTVAPVATDAGGGIRRLLLQVNGRPVTAHTVRCRLARRIALRLAPCPARASGRFAAATSAPPFRQGPNLVRLCAADYALTTAANRSCASRRIRIDNLCPISEVRGGASLRARLRRNGRADSVSGRIVDEAGRGLAGARVCVATRVRLAGVAERVISTPPTRADGRFDTPIPSGPSREVRVAYWPGPATALERYLRLQEPARPRLRVWPRRPIANGHRVHFLVRLPGPRSAGRRVKVQARAGRRWLDLRSGLTDAGGAYRARYRFHATTGRRRYRFRAAVPKQRGYPYEAGSSPVRRVTVVG